jgi:putative transposase
MYLAATYLKVRWGASVTNLALLTAVGVNEDSLREVLDAEVAGGEKRCKCFPTAQTTIGPGLKSVRLVVSDDHEGIKAAVSSEPPGTAWEQGA